MSVAKIKLREVIENSEPNPTVAIRSMEKFLAFLKFYTTNEMEMKVFYRDSKQFFHQFESTKFHAWSLKSKFELAKITSSEYDPSPLLALLNRKLIDSQENGEQKQESFALADLAKFVEMHDVENLSKGWGYLEEKLELERECDDLIGLGITLDLMIDWLKKPNAIQEKKLFEIYQEKLDVEIKKDSLDGQSITYRLILDWLVVNNQFSTKLGWSMLQQKLAVEDLKNDLKGQSIVIRQMLRWMEENNQKDSVEAFKLIERGVEINRNSGFLKGESVFLQYQIQWIERNEPKDSDKVWNLLESKLKADEAQNDFKSVGMTTQRMINWVKEFDSSNPHRERELINKKIEVATKENSNIGERMGFQLLINWLKNHEPENIQDIKKHIQRKLLLSERDQDKQSQIINLTVLRTWYEEHEPENSKIHWDLLNKTLKIATEANDFKSQAFIFSLKQRWISKHRRSDTSTLWKLMEQELIAHKLMGDYQNESYVMNKMMTWLEKYDPDNLSVRWALLSSQLIQIKQMKDDKELQGTNLRIVLRSAAKFRINYPDFKSFVIEEEFLDYPNKKPFDVLYHASTLFMLGEDERLRHFEIEEDEPSIVDLIVKQMLRFYDPDFSLNVPPLSNCITLKIKDLTDLTDEHPVHEYGINRLKGLQNPIILDGPNVLNTFEENKSDLINLINWLNEQKLPVMIHLSLNALDDFKEQIMRISENTQTIFLSNIVQFLPEDAAMLAISMLTKGTIVTNDKFRKEQMDYSEIVPNWVFEQTVAFNIEENKFVCETSS